MVQQLQPSPGHRVKFLQIQHTTQAITSYLLMRALSWLLLGPGPTCAVQAAQLASDLYTLCIEDVSSTEISMRLM